MTGVCRSQPNSSDLLERLRRPVGIVTARATALYSEAADEIERLRAKVARYEACQSKVDCLSRGDFPKVKP